ncbi:uncharacterized protein BHQ10_008480 [Talaromyces amestolkiae]|uniref:Uncharacterized protein n=1 Tax=Talaromyces amestolkiae TaxID=1196081 RepID=A0A364L9I8_TALAM|nr:uncharacterized protein BHQ10_008480 [Talaromyces amestolkiae]RAO72468.1 hypothetical protein BHQ10_008480 [Talaromyces amestolkiae]
MDSKNALDPNAPELNITVSPEELSSPENMNSKNASDLGANDAPALNLTGVINSQSAPPVGNGLGNQLRQPKPGRERNHQHLILSGKVGRQLTDQQLRDILQKSPNERDEFARITNADYVSQFVPREHDGFFIDDDLAASILQTGTEKAVYKRFTHKGQIEEWYSQVTKNGYFSITACWYGEKPEIPDCFKDLPTLIRLEECEYDPASFR